MGRAVARLVAGSVAVALAAACNPFAAEPPRPTREPEPTFRPLAGSDAQALVDRSVSATYAVAYAVAGSLGGDDVTGSWTTFQRPPELRLDMSVSGAQGRVDLRSYISPAGVIVCDVGGTRVCEEASDALGLDPSSSNELARRPQDYTVVARETIRVADEDARCFLFRAGTGTQSSFEEAFICYAADGVPLLMEMDLRDGSRVALEGRVVKRVVSDEELRPPGGSRR